MCQKMQKIARIRNNKSLIFKSTTHFSKKLYIVLNKEYNDHKILDIQGYESPWEELQNDISS